MPIDPKPLEKLPSQFIDKPNWIKFFTIWKDKWDEFYALADDLESAFDLETSVGDQLDKIGERLRWPRMGFSDDIYRRILKAIANVVRKDRGTAPVLFKITRAIFEPDIADIAYEEVYPAAYMITLSEIDESLLEVWKSLIVLGKPAGVGMHAVVAYEDAFQYGKYGEDITPPDTGYSTVNEPTSGGKYSHGFVIDYGN